MKIELLYFSGCPGYERMLPAVKRMAEQVGADLHVRAVETPGAADTERFLGSPTLRVDGVDVEPGANERDDFGLKCRIYRSEDGHTGVPPDAWIRAALDRASTMPADGESRPRSNVPPDSLRARCRGVRAV